jgi:hypothetical protein
MDPLRDHTGEAANLYYKAEWPADEKLARHVLALGNSGGAYIVIGVAERGDKSLDPTGLTEFKDKDRSDCRDGDPRRARGERTAGSGTAPSQAE